MRRGVSSGPGETPSRHPWLQLVRLPNLFTVPGDTVAGYVLAAGAAAALSLDLLLALLAGLAFYAGGLVMNDLADIRVDREERPWRPLPSGRIPLPAAQLLLLALMATGMLLCFAVGGTTPFVGGVLLLTIFGYNQFLKKVVLLGPLSMGACRALSLCLGASVHGTASVQLLAASAILTAYVAMLTRVARDEATERPGGVLAWMPAAVILGGLCALLAVGTTDPQQQMRVGGALLLAFTLSVQAALGMRRGEPRPPWIGVLVGALIPLQSAFCMAAEVSIVSMLGGFGLLALWALHRVLSRWFYAS